MMHRNLRAGTRAQGKVLILAGPAEPVETVHAGQFL